MKLSEIGAIMPVSGMTRPGQPPKPAATAQTQAAVPGVQPAANVNVGGNQTGTQPNLAGMNDADLIKALDKGLARPDVGKDFKELLAKVMKQGLQP